MVAPDVYTVGETMIRLSVPLGSRVRNASEFNVHVGGAESNVAIALARLGRRVIWVSRLPTNELGERIVEAVSAAGVDVSEVVWSEGGRVGTYFVELRPPPATPAVIYDRAGSAATGLTSGDLDWATIEMARIVHLTGITPALSGSCRSFVFDVARHRRDANLPFSVDVNYRSRLWGTTEAAAVVGELAIGASLVLCSARDAADLFGCTGDPAGVADRLVDRLDCGSAVVSDGAEGVGWCDGDRSGFVTAMNVPLIIDRLGAGDALAAGVLHGALDGDLAGGVRLGVAMATITLGSVGDAYPAGLREAAQLAEATGRPNVDR